MVTRRSVAALAAAVAILSQAAPVSGQEPGGDDLGAGAAGCPVTETRVATWQGAVGRYPDGSPAPREPSAGWVIQQGLWLNLGEKATIIGHPPPPDYAPGGDPQGTYPGVVKPSGAIRVVSPWWRQRRARPAVLRATIRAFTGPERGATFNENDKPIRRTVRTTFLFPHQGCWRINAKSRNSRFSMVVWVVVDDPAPAP